MNWLRTTVVFGILGGTALAGDSNATLREDIVKNMLVVMGNVTRTLSDIRDEDSARGAKVELRKATDEWRVLRKKSENVPPPSKTEAERLAKMYKGKLEESQKLLFGQIARVQKVPGGADALGDLAKAFAPERKGAH